MSTKIDGYRGIWFTLGQFLPYGDKYSGGLGTYTAKHVPLAIHAPEVEKTFFVYGGSPAGQRHLLAMVSYYDHRRDIVPRPTLVHDKGPVDDPHDNPSLSIDEQGHLWVFVSGRAKRRLGLIYRSRRPFDIGHFDLIAQTEITYPQPWWVRGQGFVHLFTQYTGVRELYVARSADGRTWTPPGKLAGMGGHYQVSRLRGQRLITAFNMHPGGVPDRRTNLYFAQSSDMGQTWQTAGGQPLELPLTDPASPALVRDYAAERRLVYMKDIGFDAQGQPVILYLTSSDFAPGPAGHPRTWTLAHWQGRGWMFREITTSTHNYDTGTLFLSEQSGDPWRIVGPTEPGPQYWGTGGEMALWLSHDQGRSWERKHQLTHRSPRNHAYARGVINAHPDFHAFWADGNPDYLSPSHLYFTDRDGVTVRRLPYDMAGDEAAPGVL